MELLIVLVVFAVVVWFIFFKDKKDVEEALSPAPYKLEPTSSVDPVPTTTVPEVLPAAVVEPVVQSVAPQEEKPVKAKRTTKPKSEKPAAKAPAKTRAKKPKMTVAK